LNENRWISERRPFSIEDQVSTFVSLSLFHSILQSPDLMGGRAAGQAIFDGFDQEVSELVVFGNVPMEPVPQS
jgi:hypothetical protein